MGLEPGSRVLRHRRHSHYANVAPLPPYPNREIVILYTYLGAHLIVL